MSDLLCVEGVSKTYDHAPLLREISFGVAAGEIVCLLGPSGTGKTTLLRIIAGLEEADAGRIGFEGKDLDGVPPHERGFGMMFQDLALFPHKNVFENVAFGLRMMHGPRRAGAGEITTRVNEALELVGLDAARFAGRDVNRLSGGEQQRVALARTLAPRPRLIMFDEPLGALDRILREDLVGELRALLKRLHMTALYVTHDQDEAFAIADRLVLLNAGRIEQMGTPIELYAHPANAFVARFMGLTNLVEIKDWRIEAGVFPADWKTDKGMRELETGERENGGQNAVARTDVGRFIIDAARVPERGAKYVLLRPKALERIVETSERAANVLRGRVTEMQWRGGQQRIVVDAQGHEFAFEVDAPVAAGREVVLELKASEIDFLPAE
ncbi:MAG: ABC transporter ATP-binding protein [Anaerolineae bacterium]|nr:ABC transporter ATP-binding protein [Anaerolineae bacterium]